MTHQITNRKKDQCNPVSCRYAYSKDQAEQVLKELNHQKCRVVSIFVAGTSGEIRKEVCRG